MQFYNKITGEWLPHTDNIRSRSASDSSVDQPFYFSDEESDLDDLQFDLHEGPSQMACQEGMPYIVIYQLLLLLYQ